MLIGHHVKPSFNYSYEGNAFNFVSRAIVAPTLSGEEVVWDRAEPRTFTMGFQYLPEEEIFTDFFRMLRTVKRGGEVVVIPRPDAGPLELQRRSFLGRAVNRDPISQAAVRRGHVSLEIREVMGLAPVGGDGALVLLPPKLASASVYAPIITASTKIDLPACDVDAFLFAPDIHAGAVVTLYVMEAMAEAFPVAADIGTLVDLPTSVAEAALYGPTVSTGAGVIMHGMAAEARAFTPVAAAGARINLPVAAAEAEAFAPSIGDAVLIALPAIVAEARRYAIMARTGSVARVPVRLAEAQIHAPAIGTGAIVSLPASDSDAWHYPVRIPEFDAGFDAGFA